MTVAIRIYALIQVLLLASCSHENTSSKDVFLHDIRASIAAIEVAGTSYLETPGLFTSTEMVVHQSGLLMVSDFERKVVSLLDSSGTAIDRFGGEGRGPGEFSVISDLISGPEDILYVLDKTQYRISQIRASRDGLSLLRSDSYTTYGSLELEDLHISPAGIFGVFGRIDDYITWENSYHLYRLAQDYRPDVHLLELPGYDPLHLGNGMFMHDNISSNTLWDFDGDHFFYTTSKRTDVHSFSLTTGDRIIHSFMEGVSRPLSDSTRAYYRKTVAPYAEIFPQMDDPLESVEQLPFTERLLACGKYWILTVEYAGGGKTNMLLVINRESGATGYIEVPRYFRSHGLIGRTLFGIDMDGDNRVMKLHLASLPE